jgi:hypothetical protein
MVHAFKLFSFCDRQSLDLGKMETNYKNLIFHSSVNFLLHFLVLFSISFSNILKLCSYLRVRSQISNIGLEAVTAML